MRRQAAGLASSVLRRRQAVTSTTCPTCGASHGECLRQCVICGRTACGGIGVWACHFDTDTTPVCKGACWRTYTANKQAAETEAIWLSALKRWGSLT